ncbi:MAG: Na+/H+ antiporter subunit E [Acidimicrobiia bacterium]
MSYIGPTIWLTALWVGLWRSTTPATLLTGVVLAVALTWAVRRSDDHRERHRIHPLPLLRYLGHMLVALVRSNVELAREVLTPTDYTRPGILEVRLPPSSELVLTVIANSITLTPGTITLELRAESSTLVVHVLHLRDTEAARAEVEHLHRLATAAFEHVGTVTSEEATAP